MDFTPEQRAFLDHVQGRMRGVYHQVSLKTHFDLDKEILTFYLWNLSGQLRGFQKYNWKGDKTRNNSEGGKYFSISPNGSELYGLEWLNENVPVTFICEGIFDAISLLNYGNAVAVLTNDPKSIRQQISLLPGHKVVVCDNDRAGLKLAKYGDDFIVCPPGEDPNSMTLPDLKSLLGKYAIERDFFQDTFRHWWDKQGILLDDPTGR